MKGNVALNYKFFVQTSHTLASEMSNVPGVSSENLFMQFSTDIPGTFNKIYVFGMGSLSLYYST